MGTIVSGMRPTGRLHLGHYDGVIRNWIDLQNAGHGPAHCRRCYFFVADLHALTDRTEPEEVWRWSFEMVKDWLALGIDPDRATIFIQSHVPGHVFLATLLGMVTPVSWLERCPTYKDRVGELGAGSENQGLLSYPVLMAADVALYGADRIPVGEDQVVHLELAREIIRKFNARFPGAELVEPQPLLTRASRLTGTDGKKMSKSYGNTIEMSASREETEKSVRGMKTDEARQRRTDPGEPARCNLFPWHEIYSRERTDEIQAGCRAATLGCVDCKKILIESLDRHFAGYRERRAGLSDEVVHEILERGARTAIEASNVMLTRIRKAIGLVEPAAPPAAAMGGCAA